jgi:hypothetical protein
MNKYLVMFAAGLASVASASGVSAKNMNTECCKGVITLNMHETTPTDLAGGYTYCDLISVGWTTHKGGPAAAQSDDLNSYCYYGFVSHGTGATAKIKGTGKTLVSGDDQLTVESGGYSYAGLAFEYSFPLTQGGTYSIYASTTCCSSFLVNQGTYNVLQLTPGSSSYLDKHSHHPLGKMKRISVIRSAIAKGLIKLPKNRGSQL